MAPEALLQRIESELRPYLDATPTGPDDFSGDRTRRTGSLIARSPGCRELVMHPLALGTARTFLGHATNIQLHLTQAIAIGPGETPQPIHRDQWAFDFFPFPAGYEVQCNTIWALTDFTEENGATRVVVGSNLQEDRLSFGPDDTEPADMARGSVLFYSGSVYHGGGANRSDATRIGLNITYNVAWLRQEENQYLSVPREVAETLPTDLLRLMGYDRGAYALGYIDDLRDPIEAVRPGIGTVGVRRQRVGRRLTRRRCIPCAISRFTGGHHYRGCRARRDPPGGGRRPRRAVHGVQPHRRRRRGVPPAATADAGGLRRLLDPPFGGRLRGPLRRLPDRRLLHQAQLRGPGRPHRQRRLLRARRRTGARAWGGRWWSTRCARRAASASTP